MLSTITTLDIEAVEILAVNITEELLRGRNTLKSETMALKVRIKVRMLRTISHQRLTMNQEKLKKHLRTQGFTPH
ncbi:ribosome-binding protein aMBF1 (putative translation factor) [Arcicella sp. BE140]|uniref:hypothetical protein n=1 Tax=unclassified Arcicella TaxID=2644986 RepID=UPI0028637B12|nr:MULTISPECIES: hypothetical protein [unclassified Arcicella]MDR6560330.1 ribosome-binding protein aMBF1 (putative translation factor) [Arcicella sp. BE51]MDR6810064.1 ribosome-binding protein aMBF1 (putative translation factor) [Arcicella sp. BE140]MDR6821413.1 ribosome-binding protein aMBF1 (putative translation factor) [Arcicella sp. BE139]